jgi:hypothetical protein
MMKKKIPIAEFEGHQKILELFPTSTHLVLSAHWAASSSLVGCQATSLSSVRVDPVSVVDAADRPTIKQPDSYITEGSVVIRNPASVEFLKVRDSLLKGAEDLTYKALAEILWSANDYNMYILGDNLMKGSGTQAFAQWLIDNEYGIVTSSPGVINRCHRSDPHFCQVWIWVPPQAARLSVPARKPVVGTDKMDPDAIVGQKMVNENGVESQTYKVQPHDKWHKDLNFVKKALVLSKAEMAPIKRERVVRKKLV